MREEEEMGSSQSSGAVASSPQEATRDMFFTLVFQGDLRAFEGNPLHTDTPFGRPLVVGIGNTFDERDDLAAEVDNLRQELDGCGDALPAGMIDFRAKAEQMHRRAQKAEGELHHALAAVQRWCSAAIAERKRADTHRNMRDKQRKRANRWQSEAERLHEERDPLRRIIALGKRFSAQAARNASPPSPPPQAP